MQQSLNTTETHVWDLPVRLFHWSLVILIPAMYITAENKLWGWHFGLGALLLGLLIFRVLWGFVGTRTARFSDFVKGPGAVLEYLRGDYEHKANKGHNPLGALSVLALIGAVAAQVGMGLVAGDPNDGHAGPLNGLLGTKLTQTLTGIHHWFVYVVFGLIAIHLIAIAFYVLARHQTLIGPMIDGKAPKTSGVEDNSPTPWGSFFVAIVVSLGIAVWVWYGAPPLN